MKKKKIIIVGAGANIAAIAHALSLTSSAVHKPEVMFLENKEKILHHLEKQEMPVVLESPVLPPQRKEKNRVPKKMGNLSSKKGKTLTKKALRK